jgi:hypothetical protein
MIWPLHLFWTFTPWQWIWALVWNIAEWTGLGLGSAGPWVFEQVMGMKGVKK